MQQLDFAFLIHPFSYRDVFNRYPIARFVPRALLRFILKLASPVTVAKIQISLDGLELRGMLVSVPLLPSMMLRNRDAAFKHVVRACKLAQSRGVSYIGLGALTSVVSGGGTNLEKHFNNICITNGNALTASTTALDVQHIISERTGPPVVCVIGATGSIGSAVTQLIARDMPCSELLVVGRTPEHVELLMQSLAAYASHVHIRASTLAEAVPVSDVVILATSASGVLVTADMLKPNAVVYDVTQPKNTPRDLKQVRPDVVVYEGGLVVRPESMQCAFRFPIPDHTLYSCLAETILLAASKHSGHFSLGLVSLEHIAHIQAVAQKYGVRPARHVST